MPTEIINKAKESDVRSNCHSFYRVAILTFSLIIK